MWQLLIFSPRGLTRHRSYSWRYWQGHELNFMNRIKNRYMTLATLWEVIREQFVWVDGIPESQELSAKNIAYLAREQSVITGRRMFMLQDAVCPSYVDAHLTLSWLKFRVTWLLSDLIDTTMSWGSRGLSDLIDTTVSCGSRGRWRTISSWVSSHLFEFFDQKTILLVHKRDTSLGTLSVNILTSLCVVGWAGIGLLGYGGQEV